MINKFSLQDKFSSEKLFRKPMGKLLNKAGVKPIHIIFPIILSFAITLLDGIAIVLLIPLSKGIISHDFTFTTKVPVLGDVIAVLLPRFNYLTNIKLSKVQSTFLFFVAAIFLVVVLKNILSYINSLFSDYWGGKFERNISNFVFSKFINFGKSFFDKTNKGYVRLVLEYSSTIKDLFDLFQETTLIIFSLLVNTAIMFTISWKLTVILLSVSIILYRALRSIIRQLGKLAVQKKKALIKLNENISNIFPCVPLVKAYSKEKEIEEIYGYTKEQIRELDFKSSRIRNLIPPVQEIIVSGFLLLIMSVAVLFFTKGDPAKISVFVVFIYIARKALPNFRILNQVRIAYKQIEPQLKELLKNLEEENKFLVFEGKTIFKGLKNGIIFNHLNFSYTAGVPVLKDINFFIEKGKTTAIVGPSGSGKTTLINLIMRFYDCPPSSIIIDEVDIRDFTSQSLRANIALVSQEAWLFNDTLKNNMIFGLDSKIADEQLIDIAKKSRLYDLFMQLPRGFDTLIGDGGVKLSGGEKQRVAIARSLFKNSEMLILDEATSSLDSKTEKLIQEAIEEAIKGRTAIVIAHRLSTIKNADKIAVIENGYFMEEGSLDELIEKKGKFYEYWEAQKFY